MGVSDATVSNIPQQIDAYILNAMAKISSLYGKIEFWRRWWWMMNCFWGMVDRRKAFSLISSRHHCQRSSPSRISDTPRTGFEPVQNLSSSSVEWSCAVVITITLRRNVNLPWKWLTVFQKVYEVYVVGDRYLHNSIKAAECKNFQTFLKKWWQQNKNNWLTPTLYNKTKNWSIQYFQMYENLFFYE